MTKRLPAPAREDRPPIPAFTPVPRRYRHDGWTPERQRAFIGALADTGCIDRAARQVNIAQTNCYALRRAPGAESFRKAWDAALDFTVPKLKDIAFQRAIEGELVPVFIGGKLMGFRRKFNDKLLMFILRHYGQDADGKRVTVNYFSSRASAGVLRDDGRVNHAPHGSGSPGGRSDPTISTSSAAPQDERIGDEGQAAAGAEASVTSVRTVISGGRSAALSGDEAAAAVEGFAGVALDPQAQAEIGAALEACAARARASREARDQGGIAAAEALADDPEVPFVPAAGAMDYRGALEPVELGEAFEPFTPGESQWELAGEELRPDYAAWLDAQEAQAAAETHAPGAEGPEAGAAGAGSGAVGPRGRRRKRG